MSDGSIPLDDVEPQDEHAARVRAAAAMTSNDPAEQLRGELFVALDRLAFALEMEAAAAVEKDDDDAAVRLEEQRLGVRLAQRLVAGVHADEVDGRLHGFRRDYDLRTGGVSA